MHSNVILFAQACSYISCSSFSVRQFLKTSAEKKRKITDPLAYFEVDPNTGVGECTVTESLQRTGSCFVVKIVDQFRTVNPDLKVIHPGGIVIDNLDMWGFQPQMRLDVTEDPLTKHLYFEPKHSDKVHNIDEKTEDKKDEKKEAKDEKKEKKETKTEEKKQAGELVPQPAPRHVHRLMKVYTRGGSLMHLTSFSLKLHFSKKERFVHSVLADGLLLLALWFG